MNTRRNKVLIACAAFATFLFSSCQEVDQTPVTKESVSDIRIESVAYAVDNATLNNNSTVTFDVTVKNFGGADSAGVFIQSEFNGVKGTFVPTGAMDAGTAAVPSTKKVSITWRKPTSGEYTASFYIGKASTGAAVNASIVKLSVATAELAVKTQKEVTVDVATNSVDDAITTTAVPEGTSLTDLVANIDQYLADTATANKVDDNSKEVLKSINIIADAGLLISKEAKPTNVTFDDPTVSALFIPLAKEVTDTTTNKEKVVVEEGSFLVMVSTQMDEVSQSTYTEEAGVVETVVKQPVSVPLVVKRDATSEVTTIKNSFGGISISKTGVVSLTSILGTRAIASEFWPLIQKEISAAALVFVSEMAAAGDNLSLQMNAFVKLIGKISSVINAYELMSVVTNSRPVIQVTASVNSVGVQVGNDRILTSWDVFNATATDDKPGVKFVSSGTATTQFDPGFNTVLTPKSFTFTAIDSDGDSTRLTVTSNYTRQTQVNYFVHDQGGVK